MHLLQSIHVRNAEAEREVSMEEKLFIADKKAPKLKPLHKGSLSFEPVMLKSALFRPASGPRATFLQPTLVPSHGASRVYFTGEELRQDDQRVLLMLLKARAGQEINNVQAFVPRQFVREVLEWADSGESVAKLRACLTRLQTARVRVEYSDGGLGLYSFVSSIEMDKSGHSWSVSLSPLLVAMYKRSQTYLPMAERLALGDGLNSWLFGFIKADACLAPFAASDLRDWSAKTGYAQKQFNQDLKTSLECMAVGGAIASFAIKNGIVTIYKTAPSMQMFH
jgi:hypothetical protein